MKLKSKLTVVLVNLPHPFCTSYWGWNSSAAAHVQVMNPIQEVQKHLSYQIFVNWRLKLQTWRKPSTLLRGF